MSEKKKTDAPENAERTTEQDEAATVVREALSPLRDQMAELQRQLDEYRESGEKPDADKVVDVEEKLADARREFSNEMRDLRLALGDAVGLGGSEPKRDRTFDGVFVRNVQNVREGFRQHGSFESAIKARAFDTTDLATAGVLTPRQANVFIDQVIAEQDTLSRIRTVRMGGPTRLIEELTLGNRKIRAATENTAPSGLAGVGSRKRTLTAVEVILAEDITLNALEDNIEGGNLEGHIARMLATQFGNDLNDLAWNGDASFTDSSDAATEAFLSINNGFWQIMGADANVNDVSLASGISTHTDALNAVLRGLPAKFKRSGMPLYYFVPVEFAEGYLDQMSTRATALGDTVLRSGLPAVPYFGRMLIADSAISAATAKIVLTPGDNLVFGVHRDIRIESEWAPRKRAVEYTLSSRFDFEVAIPEAISKGDSVPSGLLS